MIESVSQAVGLRRIFLSEEESSSWGMFRPVYAAGGLGGFGRTAHSLVEVRGGACVCMAFGHLALL